MKYIKVSAIPHSSYYFWFCWFLWVALHVPEIHAWKIQLSTIVNSYINFVYLLSILWLEQHISLSGHSINALPYDSPLKLPFTRDLKLRWISSSMLWQLPFHKYSCAAAFAGLAWNHAPDPQCSLLLSRTADILKSETLTSACKHNLQLFQTSWIRQPHFITFCSLALGANENPSSITIPCKYAHIHFTENANMPSPCTFLNQTVPVQFKQYSQGAHVVEVMIKVATCGTAHFLLCPKYFSSSGLGNLYNNIQIHYRVDLIYFALLTVVTSLFSPLCNPNVLDGWELNRTFSSISVCFLDVLVAALQFLTFKTAVLSLITHASWFWDSYLQPEQFFCI